MIQETAYVQRMVHSTALLAAWGDWWDGEGSTKDQ